MQTPRYEYSKIVIQERIEYFKSLSLPYGIIVRYAVKANPYSEIISMMNMKDIHFDASSSYEATELLKKGIAGERISLSSQQSPHNLEELLASGVLFVATSQKQIDIFLNARNRPDTMGVRINPDLGDGGHNKRTSTGGVSASFGIWHEYADAVITQTKLQGVSITRMHIHIGSGADAAIWGNVIKKALDVCEKFVDVVSLDIGGGFKVHRYGEEKETNMHDVFGVFTEKLEAFYKKTGRTLQLEIEPGTYFVAHAGTLVAQVDDIVDTGKDGFTFLRLNTGMNDFLRSTLYGARHKIAVCNDSKEIQEYVVVGHNCESGDIFTPKKGNPEEIETVVLTHANIGDEVRIYDTGAYCASMRAKGYNSFPDAIEVLVE